MNPFSTIPPDHLNELLEDPEHPPLSQPHPGGVIPLPPFAPLGLARAARGVDAPPKGGANRLRDPLTGRFVSDPANPPSPYKPTDAQRRAAWKSLAQDPNSPLTAEERAQIQARGWRGPQRVNPQTGVVETMELSHEPIPAREGGTEVFPRWPADHAAVDPYRQLKKQ